MGDSQDNQQFQTLPSTVGCVGTCPKLHRSKATTNGQTRQRHSHSTYSRSVVSGTVWHNVSPTQRTHVRVHMHQYICISTYVCTRYVHVHLNNSMQRQGLAHWYNEKTATNICYHHSFTLPQPTNILSSPSFTLLPPTPSLLLPSLSSHLHPPLLCLHSPPTYTPPYPTFTLLPPTPCPPLPSLSSHLHPPFPCLHSPPTYTLPSPAFTLLPPTPSPILPSLRTPTPSLPCHHSPHLQLHTHSACR